MATKVNVKSFQDMPPAGGYPKLPPFTRQLGQRGPGGFYLFGIFVVASTIGFNLMGRTNERKRLNRKEQREGKMALYPYFQTEDDHKRIFEINENAEWERKVMKDNPNWVVNDNIYSKRWRDPTQRR